MIKSYGPNKLLLEESCGPISGQGINEEDLFTEIFNSSQPHERPFLSTEHPTESDLLIRAVTHYIPLHCPRIPRLSLCSLKNFFWFPPASVSILLNTKHLLLLTVSSTSKCFSENDFARNQFHPKCMHFFPTIPILSLLMSYFPYFFLKSNQVHLMP